MRKLLEILVFLLAAAAGSVLLLLYGLAWTALGQASGLGTVECGVSISAPVMRWDGVLGLPAMLQGQFWSSHGAPDALAGGILGYASALAWLSRRPRSSREARGLAEQSCRSLATIMLCTVGIWSLVTLLSATLPDLAALARQPQARAFWLAQLTLTGVIFNPKLWWAAFLLRALDAPMLDAPVQASSST